MLLTSSTLHSVLLLSCLHSTSRCCDNYWRYVALVVVLWCLPLPSSSSSASVTAPRWEPCILNIYSVFYMLVAFPATQPIASKHCRPANLILLCIDFIGCMWQINTAWPSLLVSTVSISGDCATSDAKVHMSMTASGVLALRIIHWLHRVSSIHWVKRSKEEGSVFHPWALSLWYFFMLCMTDAW